MSVLEMIVVNMNNEDLLAKKKDQWLSYKMGLVLDFERWMLANTIISREMAKRGL